MGMPGPFELIIIFLVVLLVFGAKRIPEIARGVGKGIREFKDATNSIKKEIESEGQQRQQSAASRRTRNPGGPLAPTKAPPSRPARPTPAKKSGSARRDA
ncbi:MAG: twin-arginine translocase TatA/TatE family subunit [Bacteroidetes bacterium QS_7_67_15]|nr:MAG: twin-arginine translocase TatA/TatE family subunit [Bacteroidetes bacterium QS_7_67_15]